jgi:phage-related holin
MLLLNQITQLINKFLQMSEFALYLKSFSKIFLSIKSMTKTPLGIVLILPSVSLALLSNLQIILLLMLIAYIVDFLTGILASWMEHKKGNEKIKVYFIESAKLRKSVIKAICYMLFIAGVYLFEKAFFIKTIAITSISDKELTITSIAVVFCFVIEFFSILENLKRSGFDLIGQFKGGAKKIHSLIKSVKGDG